MKHVRAYTAQKDHFQAGVEKLRNQMVEFMKMHEHFMDLQRGLRSLQEELDCSRKNAYSLQEDLNRLAIRLELEPIPVQRETRVDKNPEGGEAQDLAFGTELRTLVQSSFQK
jgi:hypothetical protein